MAIKTIEELMAAVRSRVGEDTSDEAIAFVEDVSDTLASLSNAEDWKKKYEDNDAEWRKRYQDRFFNPDKPNDPDPEPDPEPKKLTFDELFKEDK